MSEYQQRAPRPKNALDEFKLRLSAKKLDGGEKRPQLAFSVIGNNPRIDVYTNLPNDKNRGNIRAAMDTPTFHVVLESIKDAIAAEPGWKRYIENKMPPRREDRQPGKYTPPETVSKTVIGKDKEGVIFISVISVDESRPKIKFDLLPNQYHSLAHPDGTPYGKGEASAIYARAYYTWLCNLVDNVLDSHYKEPERRGGGNRGGGGYGGNRGGGNRGGGGGQQRGGQSSGGGNDFGGGGDSNWDDDIPL